MCSFPIGGQGSFSGRARPCKPTLTFPRRVTGSLKPMARLSCPRDSAGLAQAPPARQCRVGGDSKSREHLAALRPGVAGAVNASALALRACARGALIKRGNQVAAHSSRPSRVRAWGFRAGPKAGQRRRCSPFERARVGLFRPPMEGRSRNTFPKPAIFTRNRCNSCNFNNLHM